MIIGALRNYITYQIRQRFTTAEKEKLAQLPTRAELETLVREIVEQNLKNK